MVSKYNFFFKDGEWYMTDSKNIRRILDLGSFTKEAADFFDELDKTLFKSRLTCSPNYSNPVKSIKLPLREKPDNAVRTAFVNYKTHVDEDTGAIVIYVVIPGVAPGTVSASMSDTMLTIKYKLLSLELMRVAGEEQLLNIELPYGVHPSHSTCKSDYTDGVLTFVFNRSNTSTTPIDIRTT